MAEMITQNDNDFIAIKSTFILHNKLIPKKITVHYPNCLFQGTLVIHFSFSLHNGKAACALTELLVTTIIFQSSTGIYPSNHIFVSNLYHKLN